MKTLLIAIVISVFSIASYAQEETLLEGQIEHGGYGSVDVKFTQIKDEFGVLVGGKAGWIINHNFVLGGGGYGLVNRINVSPASQNYYGVPQGREQMKIMFGYGGGILEYIGSPNKLIHYSVGTLIGAGGVMFTDKDHFNNDYDFEDDDDNPSDVVFVIEPSVNVELNVTSFFRINAGASYRAVSGVNVVGLKNSDLGGPSASLTFKFGKF